MDHVGALKAFTAVVDCGSFVAASRHLDQSPAAITRLVGALEQHVGARLLHRSTRRLSLTHIGTEYLARIRQILIDLAEAESVARDSSVEPRGVLRLVAPPSFATHLLAPCLAPFRRQCPDVRVRITHEFISAADADFDVSIIYSADTLDGNFVAHLLARSRVSLCASPEHLTRHGTPRVPQDLMGHDCLVATAIETFRHWDFSRSDGQGAAGHFQFEPEPCLCAPLVETVYAAAMAGMGLVALPQFVIEPALASGALKALLPSWSMRPLSIHAAVPTRKYLPARARAFLDHLRTTFSSEPRSWSAAVALSDRALTPGLATHQSSTARGRQTEAGSAQP
jgi:DNA-binding transcriptional LysR family regulator